METANLKPTHFKYNDDQENALEQMVAWSYKELESPFFTLSGAAGTGKTTVLNQFIIDNKFNKSVVAVTAPTHKAVRIVSNTTGLKGLTIQKLLGLRPNYSVDEFDINNPHFDPRARKEIEDYRLVIVDEASMINKDLYYLITKEALARNCKILFVGDRLQLPPVNESISLVFTKIKNKFNLTKVVRQSDGNPLLEILDLARGDARNGTYDLIKKVSRPHVNFTEQGGYGIVDINQFGSQLTKAFKSDKFSKDIDFAKYCAYTNDNVLNWNNYIRKQLYGDASNDLIIKDDLVTAYSTILDEFQSMIITNSEDYLIDDIQDYKTQSNLKGYIVRFRKIQGGQYTPYMFIVDTNDRDNKLRFLTVINRLLREAYAAPKYQKRVKWEAFYEFKDNHLLIQSLYDDSGKLIISKDIDYGYCLTTHKTQGSTYNYIFVNFRDIIYNQYGRPRADKDLVRRLIYVAISRAKEGAIILI